MKLHIRFRVAESTVKITEGIKPAGNNCTEDNMLNYSILFLVVALLAAILGFSGIAAASAGIAKVLFVLFLVLFLVSLVAGRRTV